jgi:virginiamycin B lyase
VVVRTSHLRNAIIACVFMVLVACSSGGGSGSPSPSTSAPSSPSATLAPSPTQAPEPTWLSSVNGQQIHAVPFGDWVLVAFHRAWVLGVGRGIGAYDVATGELAGTTQADGETCAAPDDGFGSLWVPTCGDGIVDRVDPETGEVVATIRVAPSDFTETSVGAGEGGVWIVADGETCSGCTLVRIDPDRNRIAARYDTPKHGTAVRAGLGGIWISYPDTDEVLRIDPASGTVVARIDVGAEPRFLDVGLGGVWVMNQVDGSVSHIDPKTNQVVETIQVDEGGIGGGDLTIGEGSVWVRASLELVAVIDPEKGRVVRRIGPALGSGSASAGDGQLWISAHDEQALYRIPLA